MFPDRFVSDEDGTLFGGNGGTALPRSEVFSQKSTFGVPYGNDINGVLETGGWIPRVPITMRSDIAGRPINVTEAWLFGSGFGHARLGCEFVPSWNGWKCPDKRFGLLGIESMDADNELRRTSPVAFVSDEGTVNLMNGFQDHGWCFSYTCLKRMMMFYSPVKIKSTYSVFFSGKEPANYGVMLTQLPKGQNNLLHVKIFYTVKSVRRMVKVDGVVVEDVNLRDGKLKSQLVREGVLASNNGQGGYTDQELDIACGCKIGGICEGEGPWAPGSKCDTPSNVHGANRCRLALCNPTPRL